MQDAFLIKLQALKFQALLTISENRKQTRIGLGKNFSPKYKTLFTSSQPIWAREQQSFYHIQPCLIFATKTAKLSEAQPKEQQMS
jgi:hypothetical protein